MDEIVPCESGSRGNISVMEGVLDTVCAADGSSLTLPATRRLERAEISEIDRQEGLSGDLSALVNPEGVHRHSLYEIVFGIVALVIVLVVCFQIVPLKRFVRLRLLDSMETFSSAVIVSDSEAIPFIAKGTKIDEVLGDIGKLADKRQYGEVTALCRKTLNELGDDKATNREWSKVWAAYLETLVLMRDRRELMVGCRRLAKIDPDSDVAAYYRARYWLLEIGSYDSMGDMESGMRDVYQRILKKVESDCDLRLRVGGVVNAGKELKNGDARMDAKIQQFGLVLAEVRLQRWLLGGRKTDQQGLKVFSSAIATLKRLPQSRESTLLELRAWEELGSVCYAWHSLGIFNMEVCGEPVDKKWIAGRVATLRSLLMQGGAK